MLTQDDKMRIDNLLIELTTLLAKVGLVLKQKVGYKAGKLSRTRNWCQLVDGDVSIRTRFPSIEGKVNVWKLFARFNTSQPPMWPWDKPERYERKKAQWMISGEDVWGVSYETMQEWLRTATGRQLIEQLVKDLRISYVYAYNRYC